MTIPTLIQILRISRSRATSPRTRKATSCSWTSRTRLRKWCWQHSLICRSSRRWTSCMRRVNSRRVWLSLKRLWMFCFVLFVMSSWLRVTLERIILCMLVASTTSLSCTRVWKTTTRLRCTTTKRYKFTKMCVLWYFWWVDLREKSQIDTDHFKKFSDPLSGESRHGGSLDVMRS